MRSEKIRTYNFPQNRVTDHRVNYTVHDIKTILNGERLDEIIDTLNENEKEEMLESEISRLFELINEK